MRDRRNGSNRHRWFRMSLGGWPKRDALLLCSAFVMPACAIAIDDPVPEAALPPVGTGGDAAAGVTATAGSLNAGGSAGMGGKGAGTAGAGKGGMEPSNAGMSGAGAGGAGGGRAGAGGAGKGGTGMAGDDAGGAGGTTSGAGGSSSGKGGAGGSSSGKGGAGGGSSGKGGAGGGSSGKGGSAGSTAGTGGKGGNGSGGTTGGTGGDDEAEGCARLSVPLNGANDKAHFTISLSNAADLSDPGTTISMRIYVEDGSGGVIFAYAQDGDYNFLGPDDRPALEDQAGWVTLDFDIAAEPNANPPLDKSSVQRIGIEINAESSTDWSNPTIVFVDSISVSSTMLSFPFNTSSTVSTSTNQTSDPSSQVLWINADSSDTTASGTALSWVASCP
jgi:hypothetical protein